MERTDIDQDERFQWLRFVLDPSSSPPEIRDWPGLLDFAKRQALVGICSPTRFKDLRLEKKLLLEWVGLVTVLAGQNETLDRQVVILVEKLKESDLRCCILKGQGNALMYPDPSLRMPGDIDVWVDAERTEVLQFAKKLFPDEKETFKHIKFPLFKDTEVDMHFTPLKFYHPFYNKRLQRWIEENKGAQMTNFVKLPHTETDVAVPTLAFNAVYQLGHIMIHIEDEGIGLRQFVDYYFVLKQLGEIGQDQKDAIRHTWKRFGMLKLSRAVMWIEHMMLGLPEEYLLVAPDERKGRLLADDILEGGNFGRYSNRQGYSKHGRFVKKCANAWHLARLSMCFPGEAFFRMGHKLRKAYKLFVKR